MPDVLDQSEVDALLAAMDAGGDLAAATDAYGAGRAGIGAASHIEVQTYDFKRPERVSKDQIRALEALHDGFARNLGASLSGYLRTIIEVSVSHIEQLTYSEFIHSLPNPTCFNLLRAEQLSGRFCLEISPLIIYPIIDRLLGGSNADLFIPQRPLTQIEQRLVQRITDRCTHHLGEAWEALVPLTFAVDDFESNPQLVQIVPPNETVVVIGFELKMGSRAGTMTLCIPYGVIEPVISRLSQQSWLSYEQRRGGGRAVEEKMGKSLCNASVEMRAVLARTTVTMDELMNLQVGDVLTTEKPAGGSVTVQIEGRNKFVGTFGQFRGSKAVRVSKVLDVKAEPAETFAGPDDAEPVGRAAAKLAAHA